MATMLRNPQGDYQLSFDLNSCLGYGMVGDIGYVDHIKVILDMAIIKWNLEILIKD